jgi:hypothetical protein
VGLCLFFVVVFDFSRQHVMIISAFDIIIIISQKCYHLLCCSDLVVASSVEDYFIHIDDLPESEKVC